MSLREQFEAAVIKRMKESGFLEVEIRVECLARSGEGYADGSVDAYWHFWQESRAALVVELPTLRKADSFAQHHSFGPDDLAAAYKSAQLDCHSAIEAAGLKVAP